MQEYFSQYKFSGDYRLNKLFINHFKPEKSFTTVPIPISTKRLQERGFNQVTSFLNFKYEALLIKSDTAAQSSLNRTKRLETKNTFALKANVTVPKKILLVDDIYTTGATLQHAISVLRNAGAKEIKTFSLCR